MQPDAHVKAGILAVINSPRSLSPSPETPDGTESTQAVWLDVSFSVILFFIAFLPRAVYLVSRSVIWHVRAVRFVEALSQGIGPPRFWPRIRA